MSSVLTCKNMQSSWGDMTGTHGAGRVTVRHRQGGVLCTGDLSKSINQIMHSPAEDALLHLISLGKISRLFSKTLQSQPCRAPARVVFFCFSNVAYDTPSLHPCCSFAWNSLPIDCHTAMPPHHRSFSPNAISSESPSLTISRI